MAVSEIAWVVEASATHLKMEDGATTAQIVAAIRRGVLRFLDFWNVAPKQNKPGGFRIQGEDLNRYDAWAVFRSPNRVIFNTQIHNHPGNSRRRGWTVGGVEIAVAHEIGHGLLTRPHLDHLPDYYNDPKFSHVMKLGAGTYMYTPGVFSPHEVQLGQQKGLRLAARPIHPYARRHQANLKVWEPQLAALKERAAKAKRDKASAAVQAELERRIQALRKTIYKDQDLTKKIVLPYGNLHAKLFSWQTARQTAEALEQSQAERIASLPAPVVAADDSGLVVCRCDFAKW